MARSSRFSCRTKPIIIPDHRASRPLRVWSLPSTLPAMTQHATPHPTLLLGGVRAGKSARAVEIARASADRGVLFVATAQALDDEMRQRIETHKAERPAEWATLESPIELARDIDRALTTNGRDTGIVI